MVEKGKRAYITPEGETIIMDAALACPRLPRTKTAEILQAIFKSKKWDIPEIEVLERKISKYRNKYKDDPQNKPWNMGSLVSHDLPASALYVLLEIQGERQRKSEEPLTIREAWWAAHLCEIIKTTRVHPRTQIIDCWATIYAREHRLSVMFKKPLETTKLDTIVRNHAETFARYSQFWHVVERKEGHEATAKLFDSLLDQEEIAQSLDKIDIPDGDSLEELTRYRKQIRKADEAIQESKKIWHVVFKICAKSGIEVFQKTKAMMASNPRFNAHFQHLYGLDVAQQLEKRIAELNERLSEMEKEAQNERPHSPKG